MSATDKVTDIIYTLCYYATWKGGMN